MASAATIARYKAAWTAWHRNPSITYDMVLTNPPFGKKSSITVINEEGEESKEAISYVRDDFWATTGNKQLNFLQHIMTVLAPAANGTTILICFGHAGCCAIAGRAMPTSRVNAKRRASILNMLRTFVRG